MSMERLFVIISPAGGIFCTANAQELPVCNLTDQDIIWFEALDESAIYETQFIGDGQTYPRVKRRIVLEGGNIIELPAGEQFFPDAPFPTCQALVAFSKKATIRSLVYPVHTFDAEFRPVLAALIGDAPCSRETKYDPCLIGDRWITPAQLNAADQEFLRAHAAIVIEVTTSAWVKQSLPSTPRPTDRSDYLARAIELRQSRAVEIGDFALSIGERRVSIRLFS